MSFELPPINSTPTSEAKVAKLRPASQSSSEAAGTMRNRLTEVALELRRTAQELRQLESLLDHALQRLTPNTSEHPPLERRQRPDRRQRKYAMIAERRAGDRRQPTATA